MDPADELLYLCIFVIVASTFFWSWALYNMVGPSGMSFDSGVVIFAFSAANAARGIVLARRTTATYNDNKKATETETKKMGEVDINPGKNTGHLEYPKEELMKKQLWWFGITSILSSGLIFVIYVFACIASIVSSSESVGFAVYCGIAAVVWMVIGLKLRSLAKQLMSSDLLHMNLGN